MITLEFIHTHNMASYLSGDKLCCYYRDIDPRREYKCKLTFAYIVNTFDMDKRKKLVKRESRKTICGIKLPPIEPVPNDNVKTITHIDPDFYTQVQGRPIRPNTSINQYKENIKDVVLKRTLQGYLVDEVTRIDLEMERERNIYETAAMHFEECQHSFNKFLAHDNDKTIVVMKTSDNLAKVLGNKVEEHKKVNYEMASLKAKLQYIDETLLILLSFEKFLHMTAPILWQQRENIKLATQHSETITMDTDIFQPLNIDLVKERLSRLSSPRLYFNSPDQLVTTFSLLEKQNLNYLLVTEELNCEKNKFFKAKDHLKALLKQELDQTQRKIQEIEEIISIHEIRESDLKSVFFKILEDKMKYLISSETALGIFNCVEFAYEKVITPNDTNLRLLDMALALEVEYDNLVLDLTCFDLEEIKEIEKQIFTNTEDELKEAKAANKILKEVDKVHKRLTSAFEPSRKKNIA